MENKNLFLELSFHRYLVYKNTSIIILFTYILVLFIPFLTNQLSPRNIYDILLMTLISLAFIVVIISIIEECDYHMDNITKQLKDVIC